MMGTDRARTGRPSLVATEKLRILVVDDNRDFAENIAELIEDLGHTAAICHGAREAMERTAREPFDIAVIDIQLPDLPGTKLIPRIKEIRPRCVQIVFTGNAALPNAIEALNSGAFAYLIKGGEVEEFRAVLSKAVEFFRKTTELEEVHAINQEILDNFPGRMMVVTADGEILRTNRYPIRPAGETLSSPNAAEISTIEDVFPPGEAWCDRILSHFSEIRLTALPSVIRRLQAAGRHDGERYLNVHFVPLSHPMARWLVFVDDVTQVVKLESDIEKSARLAALGEISATIAHEVRNPLSGISGAVQILRKKFSPEGKEREVCDQILSQVDRLNRTIEDLLVMARPITPKLADIAAADIVESVLSFIREDPQFSDIEIHVERKGTEDRCRLDPFLLRQALTNVLLNSAQAMGGKGRIAILIESDGPGTRVRVQDSGPGFPPDPSRLFEPFYTTKPAGTGLGLPITAKILEVHGGRVSLRNHETGGAEVTLTFPVPAAR